jgi:nucleoside-diphosphate-sugar epimerase
MVKALETEGVEGEIINIGTGKTRKMKEILALIKKETDAEEKQVAIDKTRLRPRDVEILVTDNSKARKLLGWKPKTAFEQGIRKTIQWYKDTGQTWGYEIKGWKWRY